MYRGKTARILPIIIVILVVAIAIAALVSLGRAIFSGGDASQPATDRGRQALINTSAGSSVQMNVRGPIVADEAFRSYQVTVTPTSRDMTTYAGYVKRPIETSHIDNTNAAYEQFVYALSRAELMNGTELTGDKDDTRGICPTGRVYEFSVKQNDSTVKRLWTSSCNNASGSLRANLDRVSSLFLAQIPQSGRLRSAVDL